MNATKPKVLEREVKRPIHPLADQAVVRLLRSPMHRLADSRLCELRYVGPKSGRAVTLPVMYAPWRSDFVVLVGNADQKQWWRAFRSPQDVQVCAGRNAKRGRGVVLTSNDARFADAAAAYQHAFRIKPKQSDRMVLIECAARPVLD
jgi:hypothetical protein